MTSDHTPIDVEHKRVEFDNAKNGSLGLESAFGCLNTIFELDETITLLTKGRSRYQIESPKLEEGAKACLTLFNPEGEHLFETGDILSTSKNSMFVGATLKGKVYGIINNDLSTL